MLLSTLLTRAEASPSAVAIEDADGAMSYAALWQTVQHTSERLRATQARTVAIDLPNSRAWVVAHLAALHAGVAQVPLPPFFTPEQRQHALRDAGVTLLIGRDSWQVLDHAGVTLPSGTALITYTSGSTGQPKGVCLSRAGMEQVAASLLAVLGQELSQRHLCVLPLAVLLEQVGGLYTTLMSAGTYVISDTPVYGDGLADALIDHEATSCILVPEMLKALLYACKHERARFPHLRFAAVGGAKVPAALLAEAAQFGLPVYQGYGLSESASVVAVNVPGRNKPGTVGTMLPHVRMELAEDGEIILQEPAILGYAGGEACCGAYPTGDIGSCDADGFLSIRGRKKNLLITGFGRNVSPEWPESALLAQPEIAQAMVYGDGEAMLSALIVPSSVPDEAAVAQAVARANASLPDYARIGRWQCRAPFTISSGELTGTGRIRREVILKHLTPSTEKPHELLRTACA